MRFLRFYIEGLSLTHRTAEKKTPKRHTGSTRVRLTRDSLSRADVLDDLFTELVEVISVDVTKV